MSKSSALSFAKSHPAGFCKVPAGIERRVPLAASANYTAPKKIDFTGFCTRTEDQGSKPWCAAYSCAQWAESILWQRDRVIQQIDPAPIYAGAKKIDGDPNGDGTTLDAVLKVLAGRMPSKFPSLTCKVKLVGGSAFGGPDLNAIMYAVHAYGRILGGFNITSEWYDLRNGNDAVKGKPGCSTQGGHAVLICGYDSDGVYIQNSWGEDWGQSGFALVTWFAVKQQFMYGCVLTHALDGLA